jgi:hypothetical protein
MDKRLAKRHKRQVARAKEKIRISEPDVRTPDQIEAAREKSKAVVGRNKGPNFGNSALSFRGGPAPSGGGAAKTDA